MDEKDRLKEQMSQELQELKEKVRRLEDAIEQTQGLEETLHVKGELYRRLVEISPDAIVLVDLEGKIILANTRAAQLYGADTVEKLIGKPAVDFVVPQQKELLKENIGKTIQAGSQRNVEYAFLKADGTPFFVEISASVVADAQGQPQALIAMVRDITDRKNAERILRENEQKLRNIIENSTNLFYTHTPDHVLTYMSPQTRMFFDCEPEEALVRWTEFATDNPINEEGYQHTQRAIDTGKAQPPYKLELKGRKGRIVWVEVHEAPVVKDGKTVAIVGALSDITDRKKAEDAVNKERRFLSNIFSSIQDGISILDTEFTIVGVNPAMEKWYAHAMPLVGKKCYEAYHSRDTQCEICPTRVSIEKKEAAVFTIPKRGPGGVVAGWLDLYSFPMFDEKTGELTGVIEYVRDITDRKKAEEKLEYSEMQHRTTFEAMKDPIHVVDTDLTIVMFNEAFRAWNRRLGLDEEAIGRNLIEIFPFLPKSVISEYRRVFEERKTIVTEERVHINDTEVFAEIQKIPVIADNAVTQVITVVRDITDRKRQEAKLASLNEKLTLTNRKLRQLSLKDHLTGLYNHNYAGEVLEREFSRVKRYAHSLSTIMFDIDYFKSINNVYGHKFGDLILKQFSRQLKKLVRGCDIVIRFGGEEFVIVSPGIEKEKALLIARRIMNAINLYNFGDKRHTVKLKLSGAVSSFPEDKMVSGIDLIRTAEYILNRAKEDGGDRVYCLSDVKKRRGVSDKAPETAKDLARLQKKLDKLTKQANSSLIEAIFAFAKTITAKDHYTGEHVERTVYYAAQIARECGLTGDEIELVKQASVLHDLGKVGISERILTKKAKLTQKEFTIIKEHPQIGVDIIRPIQVLHRIIPLIFYHHERWNGKGYPSGLKGEEIPIGARIIAVADAFQALISNRPYRKKVFTKKEALRIIKKSAGTDFDPAIVNVFLKILAKEQKK